MTEIKIPLSKTKIVLLLIAALAFVFAGAWGIIDPEKITSIRYSDNFIFIIGIVSVLFFGLAAVFITLKIFSGKPGLILNDSGIIDNSTATSVGLIAWKDITGMRRLEIASSKILVIETSNPEKYIQRSKNIISKKAMKANNKMYGSPLSIISNSLKIKFSELELLIGEQIETRRK
jgi:hypothetical protein